MRVAIALTIALLALGLAGNDEYEDALHVAYRQCWSVQ